MPNFQATLVNPDALPAPEDDLVLSEDGESIAITEHSNYAASNEVGHLQANFSTYRKLIVTDDNGSIYTYSSIGDGDATITAGSVGNLEVTDFAPQAGDSVYKGRLITIPTWSSSATYLLTNGVHVVRTVSDVVKIYKLAVTSSNNEAPESNPSKWTEITDELLVSSKYNTLGYLAVVRTIEEAQVEAVNDAADKFITQQFSSPIGNMFWLKAATLDSIVKSVANAVTAGDWTRVSWLISKGKEKASQTCE